MFQWSRCSLCSSYRSPWCPPPDCAPPPTDSARSERSSEHAQWEHPPTAAPMRKTLKQQQQHVMWQSSRQQSFVNKIFILAHYEKCSRIWEIVFVQLMENKQIGTWYLKACKMHAIMLSEFKSSFTFSPLDISILHLYTYQSQTPLSVSKCFGRGTFKILSSEVAEKRNK